MVKKLLKYTFIDLKVPGLFCIGAVILSSILLAVGVKVSSLFDTASPSYFVVFLIQELFLMAYIGSLLTLIVGGFVLCFMNVQKHYSKDSAYLFQTLPISRKTMIRTSYLTFAIVFLIQIIVLFLSLAIVFTPHYQNIDGYFGFATEDPLLIVSYFLIPIGYVFFYFLIMFAIFYGKRKGTKNNKMIILLIVAFYLLINIVPSIISVVVISTGVYEIMSYIYLGIGVLLIAGSVFLAIYTEKIYREGYNLH